ncbi:MAG: L,D-transpeptidase family protein [Actinobacteria bacterium]|nr:L,D-transpeptidase family protein [Micrococcales bacterium]MCB0903879.1 L,D-transpeptidase family protein [Actinomycetota bacterium]MCO5300817.1 Ig-like domain-containing protein [Candidatus Nanopelagicales bacterium]MCB9428878.1 L,D-transpeptidase family protein [Actinomycetota bacterium]HPE12476.1 Ig-like domain-containing protein [Actinomycetota bacterium]
MTVARRNVAIAGVAATALLAAGCGPTLIARSQTPEQAPVSMQVLPALDRKAPVNQPIVVVAEDGSLADVTVKGPKGLLKGSYNPERDTWTSKAKVLDFGAKYAVEATATNASGAPTTIDRTIKTVNPKTLVQISSVSVADDVTVGVGMPVRVTFDAPVKNKKAVEEQLQVKTSTPVTGAWNWESDTVVVFRPKKYWPANTTIEVVMPLRGVKTGPGAYGSENRDVTYQTGDSMVSIYDANKHVLKVKKNGKVIRTFPATSGKAGFETRSGVKVISEKLDFVVMDAATGGTSESDPEYYRLDVNWAMRITNSGEFVHAAPWSVGSQGYSNVSHGCVGLSTDNAYWLFQNSRVGDVIDVRNTGRPQDLGNGITEWNESWKDWLKGSKTGPVQTESITPSA